MEDSSDGEEVDRLGPQFELHNFVPPSVEKVSKARGPTTLSNCFCRSQYLTTGRGLVLQAKERGARRKYRRGKGDVCGTSTRSFMSMGLGVHLYFMWLVRCPQPVVAFTRVGGCVCDALP